MRLSTHRFNPYRVFSSAETSIPWPPTSTLPGFNPYRVFSSAETIRITGSTVLKRCFNPYRVFSSAETPVSTLVTTACTVSIPIGFSHQLRRKWPRSPEPVQYCFNPYRVFSSAETGIDVVSTHTHITFQSLSGFLIS